MVSIPHQNTPAKISAAEGTPEEMLGQIQNFRDAVIENPFVLKAALYNGAAISSPDRVVAEAELGDADPRRARALGILANMFETGADRWLEYDLDTTAKIREGINNVETYVARTWRVGLYLGRACASALNESSEAQQPLPDANNRLNAAA